MPGSTASVRRSTICTGSTRSGSGSAYGALPTSARPSKAAISLLPRSGRREPSAAIVAGVRAGRAPEGQLAVCGIAGEARFDGAPLDIPALRSISAALAHRGPDGDGLYHADNVGLAHRRLAIIDP